MAPRDAGLGCLLAWCVVLCVLAVAVADGINGFLIAVGQGIAWALALGVGGSALALATGYAGAILLRAWADTHPWYQVRDEGGPDV